MTIERGAVGVALLCLLTAACAPKHLIFTTYTDVGLDVAGTDSQPTKAIFGYKRFEGAIVPVDIADPDAEVMSVYAAIDLQNDWWKGLDVLQVFATGSAADKTAANPETIRDILAKLHAKKSGDGGQSDAGTVR